MYYMYGIHQKKFTSKVRSSKKRFCKSCIHWVASCDKIYVFVETTSITVSYLITNEAPKDTNAALEDL